jgi:hypothetical protein
MGEDVVQFSLAFHDVPLEMRTYRNPFYNWNPGSLFANYGGDDDYKYWLFCDTPDDEEFVSEKEEKKGIHSVDKETIEDGEGMPLSYLKLGQNKVAYQNLLPGLPITKLRLSSFFLQHPSHWHQLGLPLHCHQLLHLPNLGSN